MLGTLKHCHLELDSVADRNKPLPQMCYFLEFGGSRSARKKWFPRILSVKVIGTDTYRSATYYFLLVIVTIDWPILYRV